MKILKSFTTLLLAGCLLLGASCSSMSNTGKGALIGGGGGAGVGAAIGALIGGGKGAAIGGAIGAGVGAGAGALIGRKMDKQKEELQKQLAAEVQEVTDVNGFKAIKVTFANGILFPTNGTTLSAEAKKELSTFAASLINNPDTNIQVYGFTDNTGKMDVNQRVATGRADAVRNYLLNSGISANRITALGLPMQDYIASNETAEGRAQNRRVEVYITANEKMIQAAEAGTLQ